MDELRQLRIKDQVKVLVFYRWEWLRKNNKFSDENSSVRWITQELKLCTD